MRISEVAVIVGISARSIRHYHRLGVMPEPPRTPGGYRSYTVADLARIARIAFLSDSGVPLREVGALLEPQGDASADLAALRDGIDRQISQLTRQRDRLDVIAHRVAEGLPPGLLPASVTRALEVCREDADDDPSLAQLLDRERDMLDLLALAGEFPDVLTSSYSTIAADPDRRYAYLEMLRGFHHIEGKRPADVEDEIARLSDALLADPDIRALVAGPPAPAEHTGPTLEQLLPDPAQREVVRRTLSALDVIP